MKTYPMFAVLAASLLAFAGCEDKNAQPPAPSPSHAGAAPSTAQPETHESPKPVQTPAPEVQAKPKGIDLSTAQGAADGFIAAMKAGDFEAALGCLDPASEGYKDLEQLVETTKNPNIPADALGLVKSWLTSGYDGMTAEGMKVQEDQARVMLKPKSGEPITVDLSRFEGKWRLIAPKSIIQGNTVPPLPGVSAPAPTTPPTPTGTPGEPK